MKMDLEQQLLNGHSENENNENKEREQTRINGENREEATSSTETTATATTASTAADMEETPSVKSEKDAEQSEGAAEENKALEKGKEEEKEEKFSADKDETKTDDSKAVAIENGSSSSSSSSLSSGATKLEEGANVESSILGSSCEGATSSGPRRNRKAPPSRHVKLLVSFIIRPRLTLHVYMCRTCLVESLCSLQNYGL